MDARKAKAMNARMRELLAPMETEFDVKAGSLRASYGAGHVFIRAEFSEVREDGIVTGKDTETLRALYLTLGFDSDPVGRTFRFRGSEWTLTGYNTRSPKYPFRATGADGETYKLPDIPVREALGAEVQEWER